MNSLNNRLLFPFTTDLLQPQGIINPDLSLSGQEELFQPPSCPYNFLGADMQKYDILKQPMLKPKLIHPKRMSNFAILFVFKKQSSKVQKRVQYDLSLVS